MESQTVYLTDVPQKISTQASTCTSTWVLVPMYEYKYGYYYFGTPEYEVKYEY